MRSLQVCILLHVFTVFWYPCSNTLCHVYVPLGSCGQLFGNMQTYWLLWCWQKSIATGLCCTKYYVHSSSSVCINWVVTGHIVPALRAFINQCVCSRIVLVNYTSAKAVPDWFKSTIPGTKMSCGWRLSKSWPWFVFISLKFLGLFQRKILKHCWIIYYLNVRILFEGILNWDNKITQDEVIVHNLASSNLYTNVKKRKKRKLTLSGLGWQFFLIIFLHFSLASASIEKILQTLFLYFQTCQTVGIVV